MKTRLFCHHCNKGYEVDTQSISYMKDHKKESLSFLDDTYYYDDGCFFKTLNRLKREENIKEKNYE